MIPQEAKTLNLVEKDFKSTILNILKELKETKEREPKKTRRMMNEQNENINEETEFIPFTTCIYACLHVCMYLVCNYYLFPFANA